MKNVFRKKKEENGGRKKEEGKKKKERRRKKKKEGKKEKRGRKKGFRLRMIIHSILHIWLMNWMNWMNWSWNWLDWSGCYNYHLSSSSIINNHPLSFFLSSLFSMPARPPAACVSSHPSFPLSTSLLHLPTYPPRLPTFPPNQPTQPITDSKVPAPSSFPPTSPSGDLPLSALSSDGLFRLGWPSLLGSILLLRLLLLWFFVLFQRLCFRFRFRLQVQI